MKRTALCIDGHLKGKRVSSPWDCFYSLEYPRIIATKPDFSLAANIPVRETRYNLRTMTNGIKVWMSKNELPLSVELESMLRGEFHKC